MSILEICRGSSVTRKHDFKSQSAQSFERVTTNFGAKHSLQADLQIH